MITAGTKKYDNDGAFADAATIIDTVAGFVKNTKDVKRDCTTKKGGVIDARYGIEFDCSKENRERLMRILAKKTGFKGTGFERFAAEVWSGAVLAEVEVTRYGFDVEIAEWFLCHPRYGNSVREVWESMTR